MKLNLNLVAILLACSFYSYNSIGQNLIYTEIDSLIKAGDTKQSLLKIKIARSDLDGLKTCEQAELFYHEAWINYDLGNFAKSGEVAEKSLDIIKKSTECYYLYCESVKIYSNSLSKLGNLISAIEICKEAIDNLEKVEHPNVEDLIELNLKQAELHMVNSENGPAENLLAAAGILIEKIEDQKIKIKNNKKILSLRANIYARNGRMKESIQMSTNLLNIAIEELDSTQISKYNNTIALNYFRLGDYGKCKHHVEQSMEVNLKRYPEDDPKMMRNYGNMGVVCMKLRDYETAQVYYKKSAAIIEKTMGTENTEMASLIFNLGVSHYQNQEFEEAIVKFKESLRLRKKFLGEQHSDVAHSTQIIGTSLLNLNQYVEAIPYLEKALAIRLKHGNNLDPELTRIYCNLAICYQQGENISKAQSYINSAYETVGYDHSTPYDFDKLVAPFMFSNPLEIDIALAVDRYRLNGKEEDYATLLNKNILTDSIQNYLKFYLDDPGSRMIASSKYALVNDELMKGYFERYIKAKDKEIIPIAFSIFEKSKNTLMYEKLAEETSSVTIGMPNEIIDQKFALEDSIAHYEELSYTAKGEELAGILKKVNKAKSAYYAHLEQIKKEYPKFYETVYDFPIIDIKTYASDLTDQEATISYFFGNSNTFALLIKNNSSEIIDCGESIVVDSLVTIFRDEVAKRNVPGAYTSSAKELYSLLIEPCDLEGISHLNILSDNVLSMVPFEVLVDPSSDKFLMESYSTSYHYSATLQMRSRNSNSKKGEILAMAPVFETEDENIPYAGLLEEDLFRDNLTSLPNSENEVNAITSIFSGKSLSKNAATESAFKQFAPESHVLHLATHGFVNHSSPDNSRLYFYQEKDSINDGKLHAFEIVNMDLSADLVTLSACNTGVGVVQKGEGVASLGRAFAYAGCPNQLISLWPANDKSTTTIMANFYQNIANGDTKAQALHNAKKQYLATAPAIFKHPYYWSGFVYYGNDNPLLISKSGGMNWIWGALGLLVLGLVFYYFSKRGK